MQNTLTMYMVTHKAVKFIPQGRTPIFVGAGDNPQHFLRDNTADNISEKNKYYCELTAIYWIWKNDKYSSYISIEHYRRFFLDIHLIGILKKNTMIKLLKRTGAVVSKKIIFKENIYNYYCKKHNRHDIDLVREIIKTKYPDYLRNFDDVMLGKTASMLNMFAMKKDVYDKYCEWLFDILFTLETKISFKNRDQYQQRVFGFIGERLLNVWILHNQVEVISLPIFYVKTNPILSILKTIKSF